MMVTQSEKEGVASESFKGIGGQTQIKFFFVLLRWGTYMNNATFVREAESNDHHFLHHPFVYRGWILLSMSLVCPCVFHQIDRWLLEALLEVQV